MSWLERYQLLFFAAAVLTLAGALAYPYLAEDDAPPALTLRADPSVAAGAPIRVHVAGAVARPGVYDLRSGDRVIDAVEAAGGASAEADLAAVNLARNLRDGEQIVLPRLAGAVVAAATLAPGETIDINTASAELLDGLPGIGEAYSRRIVDSRALDGPYAAIEDLLKRDVVPQATFELIRGLISVGE
jgi:competence protein ComEA